MYTWSFNIKDIGWRIRRWSTKKTGIKSHMQELSWTATKFDIRKPNETTTKDFMNKINILRKSGNRSHLKETVLINEEELDKLDEVKNDGVQQPTTKWT